MHRLTGCLTLIACVLAAPVVRAETAAAPPHHSGVTPANGPPCRMADTEGFENVQIETSDIRLHEQLFEDLLHASVVQRLDHPLTDHIRIYCYRGVLVVIRQDLRAPRPTGWVQLNFTVRDVGAVQQELESAYRASPVSQLSEQERDKIFRVRLKPGVMRGNRTVDRLEVYGPEGFLIGFDRPH